MEIRRLTIDDAAAAWEIGSLAFGYRIRTMPEGWGADLPGRRTWGAVDDSGRLLGKAVDREQEHWFGGRRVPATGVAGVAVAADARGTGVTRAVLTRMLADARDRGAAISTLFDTTPVPYRRLGWEEVGAIVTRGVPTLALNGYARPAQLSTRAATLADVPAIEEIYRQVASDSSGMIDRSGPVCGQTAEEFLADWDGVTVAVEGERVVGYTCWDRGPGYDAAGQVEVGEILVLTPDALPALLSTLGSWASVAPTLFLRQPDGDLLFQQTDLARYATVRQRQPWMLRLVDAPAAIAARGWSPYLEGSVDLDLVDPLCPWNEGRFRLIFELGQARLEPGGSGIARFSPRGLAAWYAGAATPTQLRRAGLLENDPSSDGLLAIATAGPVPTLLDYF